MPLIKHVVTGEVFDVSAAPRWAAGIWECGDRRFVDPAATQYTVVYGRLPALTPMQLYLAFTLAERLQIKASADVRIREFWATYERAAQTGTAIDTNKVSVNAGLQYLLQHGVLAGPHRLAQILAGIAQ